MAAEDYFDMSLLNDWQYEYENYEPINEDGIMDKSLENVKCPDCDGPMISRKSSYGTFWGCKAYPKCKGTRDSQGRSRADRLKEKGLEDDGLELESKKDDNYSPSFSFKRRT